VNTKLKNLRIKRNIKQQTIAGILNMSTAAYCRKENGQRSFTIEEAGKLALFFKMNIAELFLSDTEYKFHK
jgi:putative transcriptional regulator